jgi:signal transduction histidine kinase/CheY-like chemotaxis protein
MESRINHLERILNSLPIRVVEVDAATGGALYSNFQLSFDKLKEIQNSIQGRGNSENDKVFTCKTTYNSENEPVSIVYCEITEKEPTESIARTPCRDFTKQYQEVAESLPYLVCMFNTDLEITLCNTALREWFKYHQDKDMKVGDSLGLFHSDRSILFIQQKIEVMRKTRACVTYDLNFPWVSRRKGVTGIQVIGILIPVFDNEKLVQVLHVYHDITDERANDIKRTNELMKINVEQEISKRTAEFLLFMSHEIRTPLTGLIGLLEHVFNSLDLTPEQQLLVNESKECGERLTLMISDILDLAKIQAGKFLFQDHRFSLGKLLEESCRTMKSKISGPLIVHTEPEVMGDYIGDPQRLKQIIVNLLNNASSYGDSKALAIIVQKTECAKRENEVGIDYVTFTVIDQGSGLTDERKEQIFKPFLTFGELHCGSSGLGLYICDKIVRMMSGCIDFNTEDVTRFWFSVPLQRTVCSRYVPRKLKVQVKDPLVHKVLQMTQKGVEGKKEITVTECENGLSLSSATGNRFVEYPVFTWKIMESSAGISCAEWKCNGEALVVDDNSVNRKVLGMILHKYGLKCSYAKDGIEAVAQYKDKDYDIVFMDCMMPNMDGYDATKTIRQVETVRRTPIIAVTANRMKEDKERCLQSGMDEYLTKPYEKNILKNVLERYLSHLVNK